MSAGVVIFLGILSAYSLRPTVGTINYRQDLGQLPADLEPFDFYIAVDDCSLIGHEARLIAGDEVFQGIVFDCVGAAGAWYFADGNVEYDEPWRMLAGEVDYFTWKRRPDIVHKMVRIEVER